MTTSGPHEFTCRTEVRIALGLIDKAPFRIDLVAIAGFGLGVD
jgi:hypothetical protein